MRSRSSVSSATRSVRRRRAELLPNCKSWRYAEKRQGTAALQDAGALSGWPRRAARSWSAAVLCRFHIADHCRQPLSVGEAFLKPPVSLRLQFFQPPSHCGAGDKVHHQDVVSQDGLHIWLPKRQRADPLQDAGERFAVPENTERLGVRSSSTRKTRRAATCCPSSLSRNGHCTESRTERLSTGRSPCQRGSAN